LAALSLGATAPALAETQLDLHIAFPAGNFHTENAQAFADRVAEETGGEVVITVHPGGSLGLRGPEGMGAVRDRIVPMADYHLMQQVGEAPFMGITALPYLAVGFEEARALDQISRPIYEAIAEANGQRVLYNVAWPGGQVFSKEPVRTLEDFAGLKIRTADKNQTDFFAALGAVPVHLPWAEVVPSLASGAIDAVTTSTSSGVDGAFWEFTPYMTRTDYVNPVSVMAINDEAWNGLTEEQRATIERIAAEMEPEFWAVSANEDATKLQTLQDNGVDIIEVSPELASAMRDAAEALWSEFAEAAGPDAAAVIEQYRAATGK